MTSPVVAMVAGGPITLADVVEREALIRRGPAADRLPAQGTPDALRLRRWIVQVLVTEAVVAHEAGTGSEHAALRVFERVTAEVAVTEEEVRGYYEANRDRYAWPEARQVRHVLLTDRSAAEQVSARVRDGEDIGEAALDRSACLGSPDLGGDPGTLRRGEFAGAVEDAVYSATPGDVVGPVRSEFGWHVVQVEGVRPAGCHSFERVREEIAADLLAAARGRAFDGWLARWRSELAVVEPEWVHPGDPSLPGSVHRH